MEPKSKISQVMPGLLVQKKKWGRGGGVKKRRGWLVVFPGLQTSNGRRLVGIQAGAVVYVPGLQHCYEQTCSPVPVGVWPVIFTPAEQRAEPQPGRANIHRTGNQAHSDLPIKLLLVELRRIALKRRWNQHFKSPTAEKGGPKRVLLLLYSAWKRQFRATVRRGCPATTTAPSAPTGKQPFTRLPPLC